VTIPQQIVMLRANNRGQFEDGVKIPGAVPELTNVGYFARKALIGYLHERGSRVWANALGWERLPELLRSLVLRANVAHADVVQTDQPTKLFVGPVSE
jgi:hypothetical protein